MMTKNFLVWIGLFLFHLISNAQNNSAMEYAWSYTYGNGTNNSIANHLVVEDTSNM